MYIVSVIITLCSNIIAVVGLALLTGFTGLFSMGHAGFMTIGAYVAVLSYRYLGVPYVFALILGGLVATLISLLVGYAPLRNKLRGDAFAICMLGFGNIVRLIFVNITHPAINGSSGISGIPKVTSLWFSLLLTALLVYMMWCFIRSQYGRNCLAIQQQEIAAEMMGVNIIRTKLLSLAISAFYCGLAGGLMAFWLQYINPNSFATTKSDSLVATLVAGGTNSVTGPILSAALLIFLLEYLRMLVNWRLVVYGLLLVIIMRFRPQGVMGYKEFSITATIRFFKDYKQIPAKIKAQLAKLRPKRRNVQ